MNRERPAVRPLWTSGSELPLATEAAERLDMGLFDKLQDAAGDLIQDGKDKLTEATGVDADAMLDAVDSVSEAGEKLGELAESVRPDRAEG
jgi:hypothetical protein